MKKLIRHILREEIGGNYYYLITTKDNRFYVSDGDDWNFADELVPMDGTLSYKELNKLHNPNKGTRLYTDKEEAEISLRRMISWYNTPEERKQSRGWSNKWTDMINNFTAEMEKHGIEWDDFEVKEFYLGLILSTRDI